MLTLLQTLVAGALRLPKRRVKAEHDDGMIVIELGDYKGMGYLRAMKGVTEIVVPPPPGGYATRREIYEAVDAALDAPLSEHGVEGYNLSVRDCYVDQDCDGMYVTEVTDDAVTAVYQYCS